MKAFASKLKRSKSSAIVVPNETGAGNQDQSQASSHSGTSTLPNYEGAHPHTANHYTHEKEVPRTMPPLAKTLTANSASSRNGNTPTTTHHAQYQQQQGPAQRPPSPPTSEIDRMMVDDQRSTAHSMRSNQSTPSMPTSHTMAYEQELPLNKQTIEAGLSVSHGPALVARETRGKYTLDDFQIQRTLGTGSFGRVHLVQSRHNARFYAIKVLKKQQVVKMKQIEHTNDERSMLRKVKHPFLITLWGTFFDSKNLYMVMDFIEGGELFSLLRKSHRFPSPVAKFYAAEVCLALDYLHHNNIIYRDLKPENLLLDRHGHIKITDFGFAKEVPDITWTLCGTPDYLAPEVVASKGYNKSVDWWSLGILTYEMLAGHPPFYDPNPMKLYENILAGHVRYPAYFEPTAKDFLQRLLTADLTKRFGNLRNGSRDIMEHAWFAEVNWERLARRDIEPPYTPPLKGAAGDAHLFDVYSEEQEPYGQGGPDPYGHLFPAF